MGKCLRLLLLSLCCSSFVLPMEQDGPKKYAWSEKDIRWAGQLRTCTTFGIDPRLIEPTHAIHSAARNGTITVDDIRSYLDQGGEITNNMLTMGDDDLIHFASQHGQADVVKFLLEQGAIVDERNSEDIEPIHIAARAGHVDILALLVDHGADIDSCTSEKQKMPVDFAAMGGSVDALAWLVEHDADVNGGDYGMSQLPIHQAAKRGHSDAVKWLIEHGADVHAEHRYREQPIHFAAKFGRTEVLSALLDYGAHVNAQDGHNKQPLDYAESNQHGQALIFLVGCGASLIAPFRLRVCAGAVIIGGVATTYPGQPERGRFDTLIKALSDKQCDVDMLPSITFTRRVRTQAQRMPRYGMSYGESMSFTALSRMYRTEKEVVPFTISDVFTMAAGQGNEKLIEYIYENYRDELTSEDYVEALVGAATAGQLDVVKYLRYVMASGIISEDVLIDSLAHALVRATSQQRLEVVLYLLEWCAPLDRAIEVLKCLLSTQPVKQVNPGPIDLISCLLSMPSVDQDDLSDEEIRLARQKISRQKMYSRIFNVLVERQQWVTEVEPRIFPSVAADGTQVSMGSDARGEVESLSTSYLSRLPSEILSRVLFLMAGNSLFKSVVGK